MLDWMGELLNKFAEWVLNLLPLSPFRNIDSFFAPIIPNLGYLNWFVPIGWIISVMAVWLSAISLFYIYSIIMRWIKMIGD